MRTIVNIDVPEIEPAVAFYTAAFGLIHNRMLDDDAAELTGGSSTLYLLAAPPDSAPAASVAETRHYSRHWTPVHLDFVVDDIDAATERVLEAGAVRESECVEWLGSKCVSFSDPFGHGFCLIEFENATYRYD